MVAGTIALIRNILSLDASGKSNIILLVEKFIDLSNFYTEPLESVELQVYTGSRLQNDVKSLCIFEKYC